MRLVLGMLLLSLACKQLLPETAKDKFSTAPLHDNEHSFGRKFAFLIKHVHAQEWRIAYGFSSADCERSASFTKLRDAINVALRTWIAPLKKMSARPFVESFSYHKRKAVPDGFISSHLHLLDLESLQPHLQIIFYCRDEMSYAMTIPVQVDAAIPDVHLFYHHKDQEESEGYTGFLSKTPFSMKVLVHEIGHAFGMLDTYPTEQQAHIGQPPAIMAAVGFYKDGAVTLATDDIKGIKWLYRYYHQKHEQLEDERNKCFFPDYELVERERGAPACVPRHPLITSLKMAHQHERLGNSNASRKFIADAKRLLSYGYGDPGKVNAQDKDGNTALHYVVMYAQASKQMHNVKVASVWKLEQPSWWASIGHTLLALPRCPVSGGKRRARDEQCFARPELNCVCIDLTIKNKQQQTARELADAEIAAAFPAR